MVEESKEFSILFIFSLHLICALKNGEEGERIMSSIVDLREENDSLHAFLNDLLENFSEQIGQAQSRLSNISIAKVMHSTTTTTKLPPRTSLSPFPSVPSEIPLQISESCSSRTESSPSTTSPPQTGDPSRISRDSAAPSCISTKSKSKSKSPKSTRKRSFSKGSSKSNRRMVECNQPRDVIVIYLPTSSSADPIQLSAFSQLLKGLCSTLPLGPQIEWYFGSCLVQRVSSLPHSCPCAL